MRYLFILSFFLFCSKLYSIEVKNFNFAQNDSSLYCHLKLTENKYWIAGKHGYLIEIDTSINLKRIYIPFKGLNILRMGFLNSKILMSTHKGSFIIYDTITKVWDIKIYKELKNKCIYDFVVDDNGQITIVGGHSKLSMGKKKIPNGYVAFIDEKLKFEKFGSKKKFRMFWAITLDYRRKKIVFGYNGFNTKIYDFPKMSLFKKNCLYKIEKLNSLIYNSEYTKKNGLIYFGSKKFNLKTGIINYKDTTFKINGGIVWTSHQESDSNFLLLNNSKKLISLNLNDTKLTTENTNLAEVPYGMFQISKNHILVYGRNGLLSWIKLR